MLTSGKGAEQKYSGFAAEAGVDKTMVRGGFFRFHWGGSKRVRRNWNWYWYWNWNWDWDWDWNWNWNWDWNWDWGWGSLSGTGTRGLATPYMRQSGREPLTAPADGS